MKGNLVDKQRMSEDPGLTQRSKPSGRIRGLKRAVRWLALTDLLLFVLCVLLMIRAFSLQRENASLKNDNEALQIQSHDTVPIPETAAMEGAEVPASTSSVSSTDADNATLMAVRGYAEQGKSFLFTLKQLFPKQFVLADEGTFHFVDIDPNLRPNTYDNDMIALSSNGIITYEDDGVVTSYGIDVSQHNGPIDWEQMKAAGYRPDFVYIRAGIRGYSSGRLVYDEQVSANIAGARSVGAETGVYFVTQAVDEAEAREEAHFVLDLINDKGTELPVVLDVEKVESYDTEPRTKNLSPQEYTANVLAFADEMKQNGLDTVVYGNGKTFMLMLDMAMLDGTDIWFADYVAEDDYIPYFPYIFNIWQFSSQGKVPGVTGDCDLNIRFE